MSQQKVQNQQQPFKVVNKAQGQYGHQRNRSHDHNMYKQPISSSHYAPLSYMQDKNLNMHGSIDFKKSLSANKNSNSASHQSAQAIQALILGYQTPFL